MVPTKNPVRKINKQIRRAKAKGDIKKVEELQQGLQHFLKCQAINEKNKTIKEQKTHVNLMSDDEFLNQAQEYNKQHLKDKQEKEKKDKEVKKRSLEKDRLRTKIANDKKVKQEQESENLEHLRIEYSNQQAKEQEFLDNVQNHKATMKVENTDKLDVIYDIIYQKTNKNKKKTKKLYNKFIHKEAMMIECAIRGYMKEHDVPYEEGCHKFYLHMKEPKERIPDPEPELEPESGPLQILDYNAKL
jgi:hypothetical protein